MKIEKSEKTMAMLCHLLAFSGYVGVPFGNIIGPLVIWVLKKDESDFVDCAGKESINFQISIIIYTIISIPFCFILIGWLFLCIIYTMGIIFVVLAAIKTNEGHHYRYPITIRFL